MKRQPDPADRRLSSASRRDILKLGGTIAAGSVLAGVPLPRVHASEDNTIRLALIGCGGRGRGAVGDAFSVAEGPIKLHAIADLTEDRVSTSYNVLQNHFSDRVDVPEDRRFVGFDGYRHAIDSLRPGDIAMLTAYAFCRPVQIEYAVKKGVNVFLEKSFAPDPAGCRRIMAAGQQAKKQNLKIAAGLQCRHSVARQALIDKIRAGELGDIPLVRATRVCGGGFLAKPPADTDHVAWQIRNRMHFLWASAGILLEMLIHQIDECCWIKDGWPVSATGKGNRADRPDNISQNFEHYELEYTFADGGKAVVESVQPFATFIHGSNERRSSPATCIAPRCTPTRGTNWKTRRSTGLRRPNRAAPGRRSGRTSWKRSGTIVRSTKPNERSRRISLRSWGEPPRTWAARSRGRKCSIPTSPSLRSPTNWNSAARRLYSRTPRGITHFRFPANGSKYDAMAARLH
jgi:predicted dehydrogenase